MARVFVYGTLKTGQPNYYRFEKAMEEGAVSYVGRGRTVEEYPLIIAGRYNLPYMLNAPGNGHLVLGEVYDVNAATLQELDRLESIPHHYQVKYITVELTQKPAGTTIECLTYVCGNFRSEMLDRPMYTEYDAYGPHRLVYSIEHTNVSPDYQYDVINRPAIDI